MAEGDGRVPKDMNTLLQICAGASDPANPNTNTSFNNLTDEDKEFLEGALGASTTNPAVVIKKNIDIIKATDADVDSIVECLENLEDWCDHLDFAIDFHKVGGFEIFEKCITHEEAEVRWQVLDLTATLLQNNPYCQQALLEDSFLNLPKLLDILDNDANPIVKTKALYAVSCLIREFPKGIDEFLQQDGFSFIMRAMETSVEKLQIKSAFLLSAISADNDRIKDILCDMGMIEQLIGLLSDEHTCFHEHLMAALLTIVKNHARSLNDCLRPELNLVSFLQSRKQELEGRDEFREEREYTEELLALLVDKDTECEVVR